MTRIPEQNHGLIRSILGDNYLPVNIQSLRLEEDLSAGQCEVVLSIKKTTGEKDEGTTPDVAGKGVGLVDAVFDAMLSRFAPEYESLKSIELIDFSVQIRRGSNKVSSGVDSEVQIKVEVRNSEGTRFLFSDESRSIAASCARTVAAIVEYFVNAERAFVTLHAARKDAMDRKRQDLVTRYTREMAEVVTSTSYTQVIESIRREIS